MPPTVSAARYRWDLFVRRSRSFWERFRPPQIFVGSFALLIVVGTLGFKFLPGLYVGRSLSWLDALFMSTSAVCVTGLTVFDVGTELTFWGQAWLLLLLQLGGLGVITFASLFVLALGGRLSLRQESATGSLDVPTPVNPRRLLIDIVRFTLIFEGMMAATLYVVWSPSFGEAAWWHAIFHAISAFCNAGFSTFPEGLAVVREHRLGLALIMAQIVLGGLGFLTLEELYSLFRARRGQQTFRLSLHSRLVLWTSGLLILAGWVFLGVLEWNRTLAELPWPDRIMNALMMSVTPRTAGFNTINYGECSEASNFVTILLMSVGGSPGSTAGGIKTTTVALIGLLAWSRFRGEEVVSAFSRSVRQEQLGRAIGLCVLAFVVVILGVLLLTVTEEGKATPGGFLGRLFEASSAFNTVGLSMGATTHLTPAGKATIIALMFLGRVGTLTFVAAIAFQRTDAGSFRYAYEDVMIG